jgi:hypothetical protein
VAKKSSSWSVVSTVRAPKSYIDRFADYYLCAGADQIFLFFDDPEHDSHSEWSERPRIVGVACNQQYWSAIREVRRPAIEGRQQANIRSALMMNRGEWLLHVDSDEFVCSQRPIGEILGEQPEIVFSVRAPSIEAVYETEPTAADVFDTHWFKRFLGPNENRSIIDAIYGDLAPLTRNGFFGHVEGKAFFRSRYSIRYFGTHSPVPIDRSLRTGVIVAGLELLHFQSLTFSDWSEKWQRAANGIGVGGGFSKKRRAQLELIQGVQSRSGDRGVLELYRRMNVFDAERLAIAISARFVVDRNL